MLSTQEYYFFTRLGYMQRTTEPYPSILLIVLGILSDKEDGDISGIVNRGNGHPTTLLPAGILSWIRPFVLQGVSFT